MKACVKGKVVFFLSLGFNVYVSGLEIKFYFYLYVYIDAYDKVLFYNSTKVLKIFQMGYMNIVLHEKNLFILLNPKSKIIIFKRMVRSETLKNWFSDTKQIYISVYNFQLILYTFYSWQPTCCPSRIRKMFYWRKKLQTCF